jgi:hypothetical protein
MPRPTDIIIDYDHYHREAARLRRRMVKRFAGSSARAVARLAARLHRRFVALAEDVSGHAKIRGEGS